MVLLIFMFVGRFVSRGEELFGWRIVCDYVCLLWLCGGFMKFGVCFWLELLLWRLLLVFWLGCWRRIGGCCWCWLVEYCWV